MEAKPEAPGEATNDEGVEAGCGTEADSNVGIERKDEGERDRHSDEYVRLIGVDYFDDGDEFGEVKELWVSANVQGEPVMF